MGTCCPFPRGLFPPRRVECSLDLLGRSWTQLTVRRKSKGKLQPSPCGRKVPLSWEASAGHRHRGCSPSHAGRCTWASTVLPSPHTRWFWAAPRAGSQFRSHPPFPFLYPFVQPKPQPMTSATITSVHQGLGSLAAFPWPCQGLQCPVGWTGCALRAGPQGSVTHTKPGSIQLMPPKGCH